MKDKKIVPVVNFIDFCKSADFEQIKKAIIFYDEKFNAEKVLEYFENWSLVYDNTICRRGKILTNKHSTEHWSTTITINDDFEYLLGDASNTWSYVPKTFSEFISDVLRYEDFELLLTEKAQQLIYDK